MEIILLALIVGLLALQLLSSLMGNEDPVLLIVAVPVLAIVVVIAGAIVLGIAWGANTLLEMFGFYLG